MSTSAEKSEKVAGPVVVPIEDVRKRLVAVIDVGTTAIRMVIAEIDSKGTIKTLESMHQGVPLGKDTFTKGRILQTTILECVKVLNGFRKVMDEYGIRDPSQIRAVATSSVREAQNRDNFLDRVYIATGVSIRAIDEAEESRLMFMAVQSFIEHQPELSQRDAVIVDVGGGSTEFLLIQNGHVAFSNSYRLGSLRMRESLEAYRAPAERMRTILDQHIERNVEQMLRDVPTSQNPLLVAVSGDARFAAAQLSPDWKDVQLSVIDPKAFAGLVDKVLPLTPEKIVKKFQIGYDQAETAGPSLLVYLNLARKFKVDKILIPKASLRDGMLKELALQRAWTDAFAEEVVHSAISLGHKYHFDEAHARQVADLCMQIFRALQKDFNLDPRHGLLLRLTGLLHEIGGFISNRSHHKHSMYLILNSDLFGLTREDTELIAVTARYHRRAVPNPSHEEYRSLDRDDRIAVSKMAAILRVADALDRSHLQQVRDLSFALEGDQFIITAKDVEDLTTERLAMKEKGSLFEEVYGLKVVLQESRVVTGEIQDA